MILKRRTKLLVPVAALAAGLAGCSRDLLTSDVKLNPFEFFSKRDFSTSVSASERNFNTSGPVVPEDLVDAAGTCAGAPVSAPTLENSSAPSLGESGALQTTPGATVVGGIALGMTECQVVQRAGQPGNIQISADAANDRAAVLTYLTGPWPGIYRFSAGRLKEVERVAVPPAPPKPTKKKKVAKPKTPTR